MERESCLRTFLFIGKVICATVRICDILDVVQGEDSGDVANAQGRGVCRR